VKDAYGVFCVTNYWEKLDGELEYKQGCNVADICKELQVKHLVWSSLKNVSELTQGKLTKVCHFDFKARVQAYMQTLDIPVTYFMAGMYMTNLTQLLRKNPGDTRYTMALPIAPTTRVPLFDVIADTGKFVKAIFLKPEPTLGKEIYGATDYYSLNDIVDTFAQVKSVDGHGAVAVQVPEQVYKGILKAAGLPDFVQDELLENFLFYAEIGYYGGASLEESQAILDEPLTTLKEYIEKEPAFADLK